MSGSEENEDCETAYNLTFHPVFRRSLYFQLAISFFAIFPLCYFLWFKLWKSSFHGNLKWLLTGYFGSILSLILDLLFVTVIQIIHPLLTTDKCDLIIEKNYYGPVNISIAFSMSLPQFFPISITIERFLATKLAAKYDKTPVLLGPVLMICDILLNFFIIIGFYRNETFEGGTVNLMLFPSSTAPKVYILFFVLLFLNLLNFLFNFQLLRQNSRLKRIDGSLSEKYQLEEVYLSTVFSISVIFLHISLYGIYLSLIMSSRYFGHLVIENNIDLRAFRGAQIAVIDLSNLIIGSVAVLWYRKLKNKKSMEISGTVEMKSTGRAGARNYEEAINNIWNSHARV